MVLQQKESNDLLLKTMEIYGKKQIYSQPQYHWTTNINKKNLIKKQDNLKKINKTMIWITKLAIQ